MKKQTLWKGLMVCLALVAIIMQGNKVFAANDSFTNATSISVNKAVTDNLEYSGDSNYYKFSLSAPGYVGLSFTHAEEESTSVGWDITLYNADRESITSYASKRSVSNVTSCNIGLPEGTYYVLISNSGFDRKASSIDYNLKINYIASNAWETEFNDGFLTADGMSVNQSVNGSMLYSGDADYYKFSLCAHGYVSLSFTHAEEESTSVGWDITLYNADRESITSYASKRSVSNVTSCNIGLPEGTYYVLISNSGFDRKASSIDYNLKINYIASNAWETEFNDGFLTADSISVNQKMNGSMLYSGDADYYKIINNKSGYVNILFEHVKLETNYTCWTVGLYDSDRQCKKTMQVAGDKKTSKIQMIYLPKGTYYILVSNSGFNVKSTNIDYQLKVYYTTPKASIKSATSPSSKKMSLKWKKLKGVTGYEIVTATDKKFKKNKKITTVSSKNKTKTTIKQLKKGKKYYVKMRGYITVDGKKYYGSYSKTKKVTIR